MDDNDHRVIGQKLDLYHIQEDAPGQVFWHPHGHTLYRVIEDYIRTSMRHAGFQEIRTPQLMPRSLWEASGHWAMFRKNMFEIDDPDRPMALKPMSCPCHIQVFNERLRSYRDLPMRYSEFGACHRNEASGSMHGLMRTRAFVQDDAHILCRKDQIEAEVTKFIVMLQQVYERFGFKIAQVGLSTVEPSTPAFDEATEALGAAARAAGLDPVMQLGEGAFYGPKLEFALRDKQGRLWQCGTVQLDFVLPGRLDAKFINENSDHEVPVMIHHAVLGSMERFIAILLEHHEGKLPLWLAPVQIALLPVGADQIERAEEVCASLRQHDIRAIIMKDDTLGKRIALTHEMAIPMNGVIGKKEIADGTVTVGYAGEKIVYDAEGLHEEVAHEARDSGTGKPI